MRSIHSPARQLVYYFVPWLLILSSCKPVNDPKSVTLINADTIQNSTSTSKAFNNLKNSERYENVQHINNKIIRKSKGKFCSRRKNNTDTLMICHTKSVTTNALLQLQFELINEQATNLTLRILDTNNRFRYADQNVIVADERPFKLVQNAVYRQKEMKGIEWAELRADNNQAAFVAISHASQVRLEFHQGDSKSSKQIPAVDIHAFREAYEYYTALGGKF